MSHTTHWCESLGPQSLFDFEQSISKQKRFLSSIEERSYSNSTQSDGSGQDIDIEEELSIARAIENIRESHTRSHHSSPLIHRKMSTPQSSVGGNDIVRGPRRHSDSNGSIHKPSSNTRLITSQSKRLPHNAADTNDHHSHRDYGAVDNAHIDGHAHNRSVNEAVPCPVIVDKKDKKATGLQKLPLFIVSLLLTFIGISSKFHGTLLDQYVYQRYASDILGDNSTHTAGNPCFDDGNSTNRALVKRVQELASTRMLHLDLFIYGLGIPACIVLGILSRTLSRRVQLLIPMFGYLFKCAGLVVLIKTDCSLDWLYLAYGVEGICGNFCGILLAVFLYTSDITDRDKGRTMAIVFLEGVKGVVMASLNIVAGDLIQSNGYLLSSLISMAAAGVAFLAVFALPDRKPNMMSISVRVSTGPHVQEPESKNHRTQRWYGALLFPPDTFDESDVRKMFKAAFSVAFLYIVANVGVKKVLTLYLMNQPICWASSTLGWFLFADELSYNTFTMFAGPLLVSYFPGLIMSVVGNISNMGGFLVFAFATTTFQLYVEPPVDIAKGMPMGIIRGELSRLVGPESQGTLFATFAVMESFSFALGAPALYIYNKTLGFYKGTVMLTAAALVFIATCISIYYHSVWKRYYRRKNDKESAFLVNENISGQET